MATEALTAAAAPGSLGAVGSSATALGTATTAFVLAHPIGMALAAGAALGAGTYWGMTRFLSKKDKAADAQPDAATA